ncbi:hypothetical protein H0H81_005010 [Sphagnurus paluster]|uniref:Uncharacterized protein n=1 Tax=Sphagnurus paluster TaxID=117069 RepID=A0A9P7FYV3_9AGAR|nr:hypothetical protein H0H81_005010 [Sphagnurus paluster]
MVEEAQLSAHIRNLLLDYVRCHITIDYVQFTQLAVAEANQVPTHDPASLTLPTDPFVTLSTLFKLSSLPSYQEKFTTSQDACSLLRSSVSAPKQKLRSERLSWSRDLWEEREEDDFYHVEPILTRRAIRQTPVLGKNGGDHCSEDIQKVEFTTYAKLMTSKPVVLASAPIQMIEEPEVKLDKVLDVAFHLKALDHAAVRALFKEVSNMSRQLPKSNMNDLRRLYLPPSYDFDAPRPTSPRPDSPPLVPIFSRNHKALPDTRNNDDTFPALNSVSQIPHCLGVASPGTFPIGSDFEDDTERSKSLSRENMVIVDGWETYAVSSPSTICSGMDDEIDELAGMFPASPDTSMCGEDVVNLVRDVEDSKLDVVAIPRERRIGGHLGKRHETIVDRARKFGGLGCFLAPLLGAPTSESSELLHEQKLKIHPLLDNVPGTIPKSYSDLQDHPYITKTPKENENTEIDSMCGQGAISGLNLAASILKEEDIEIRGLYQDISPPDTTKFPLGAQLPPVCPDPMTLIREEKLLDGDLSSAGRKARGEEAGRKNGWEIDLMPVPLLSSPTTASTIGVKGYRCYIVESGKVQERPNPTAISSKCPLEIPKFLKSVKGIASLRVALSWVPFTLTNALPTHMQIAARDLVDEIDREAVCALLKRIGIDEESQSKYDQGYAPLGRGYDDEQRWRRVGNQDPANVDETGPEVVKCDIIMTKAERQALLSRRIGAEGRGNGKESTKVNHAGEEPNNDGEASTWADGYTVLTARPYQDDFLHLGADENDGHRPSKRARLSFDDSGIEITTRRTPRDSDFYHSTLMLPGTNFEDAMTSLDFKLTSDGDKMIIGDQFQEYSGHDKEDDAAFYQLSHTDTVEDIVGLHAGSGSEEFYNEVKQRHHYRSDEDSISESFEPLSLSYDSQAYMTHDAQRPEIHDTRHRSHEALFCIITDENQAFQDQHTNEWQHQGAPDDIFGPPVAHSKVKFSADDMTTDRTETSGNAIKAQLGLNSDLATHLGIDAFLRLRARTCTSSVAPLVSSLEMETLVYLGRDQQLAMNEYTSRRPIPQEIFDRKTLRFPSSWTPPITTHKYMASLDLLQKQALVRTFSSQECHVELVERESLDGVDVIIDSETAIIFTPLLSLPADSKELLENLSAQTWRYKRLLIVFEGYQASRSFRTMSPSKEKQGCGGQLDLYAYTPPILKAIKKFRRGLGIAEGCGKKAVECEVWYGFANSVREAAIYARWFGNEAEKADLTQGAVWGARDWMDIDESEDEGPLASFLGMNRFSASIVLCQVSLQEFVDMGSESRSEIVGPFVGREAINMLNADIERRIETMTSLDISLESDTIEYSF